MMSILVLILGESRMLSYAKVIVPLIATESEFKIVAAFFRSSLLVNATEQVASYSSVDNLPS